MSNDEQQLDARLRAQLSMARNERIADIARREKLVADMLSLAEESGRALTGRESQLISSERNAIASMKLGLENETDA